MEIGCADPDGAGPLKHRAQRVAYNLDGQPTLTEVGTVASQSDADWAGFVSLQQSSAVYDVGARVSRETVTAAGTTYSVVDYSYDGLGRGDCAAQRLNPAAWGVLTTACSAQAAGASGPDRISKTLYDAASQVTQVQSALGTGVQQNVFQTFTPNGTQATLTDGKGNKTTFVYDGFDRPMETHYPLPNSPGSVSNTDYEGVQRDANGNVTLRRIRDGQLINYSYDGLDRLVAKDIPAGAVYEFDASYQYDLLGRLTRAQDTNSQFAEITYDALSRPVQQLSNFGGVYSQYDAAGRRTRLSHEDGFYTTYDYLVTGETLAIRENGAAALGTYAYDDLGRRMSLMRGNGTVTSYAYDPASRLTSLVQDFAGTLQDVTSSFTYNAASQIGSRTRSNDLFARVDAVALIRNYTNNGLNQHTTSGATPLAYDGRGNLTNSGSQAYSYTSENRLANMTGSIFFAHEPLGRMWLSYDGASYTYYQYDGDVAVREISTTALIRRHVHGPGSDAPLLTYEGAGTSDKRYLHADERGSIIAISNASGQVTQINAYDDYRIPQGKTPAGAAFAGGTNTANFGRFGYTGQAWLPEVGLSYYKARMYSPTLGRFMQTDPIGYGDGVNLYAYVGGDPINFSDPSGLKAKPKPVDPAVKQDGTGRGANGSICDGCMAVVTAFKAPPSPPRGLGFLLSANVPGGDRGGPSFGERNDGGDNATPGEAMPAMMCPSVPASRPVGSTGLAGAAVRDPSGALIAAQVKGLADAASSARFPSLPANGTARDAFRHFFGAFALTKLIGPRRALNILNAVEVERVNSAAERNMDTFNNNVAIQMAQNPDNRGRATADLANAAIANGCLNIGS